MNFIVLTSKRKGKCLVNMDGVGTIIRIEKDSEILSRLFFPGDEGYLDVLESLESIENLMRSKE